jgi:RNA polymerase sigma factor (sigma-70 family)
MQPLTVVEGINEKDPKVFEWVFYAFFPQILNTVRKTTGGSVLSEDITTDVFVALWEHDKFFETLPAISQFLYRVAINKSVNDNKKRNTAERHAEGVKTHYLNIEEQNRENAETDDRFKRIMYEEVEKLPRVTKRAFKLYYIYGLKNDQIARKMSITKRTAETHKTNAHKFLKIEVKKNGRYFIFILSFIL